MSLSKLTSETIWVSNFHPDNIHQHKIKNLNSKHIANIIHFLKTNDSNVHGHSYEDRMRIITVMMEEASKRELTPMFLEAAPYPYDCDKPYEEYVE